MRLNYNAVAILYARRPLPSEGSALSPFTPEQDVRIREIVDPAVAKERAASRDASQRGVK